MTFTLQYVTIFVWFTCIFRINWNKKKRVAKNYDNSTTLLISYGKIKLNNLKHVIQ